MRTEEVEELEAQVNDKKAEISNLDLQAEQKQVEIEEIERTLESVNKQKLNLSEIDRIQPKKSVLTGKFTLTEDEFNTLQSAAKKYVTHRRKDNNLRKKLNEQKEQMSVKEELIGKLYEIIDTLKSKISELEEKLNVKESLKDKLDYERLRSENISLKKENQHFREILETLGIPYRNRNNYIDRDCR